MALDIRLCGYQTLSMTLDIRPWVSDSEYDPGPQTSDSVGIRLCGCQTLGMTMGVTLGTRCRVGLPDFVLTIC